METLSSIECFVRTAEAGSFAEAARRLGLTPAAVGKNVARLESSLGVRLFLRSTRRPSHSSAHARVGQQSRDSRELAALKRVVGRRENGPALLHLVAIEAVGTK